MPIAPCGFVRARSSRRSRVWPPCTRWLAQKLEHLPKGPGVYLFKDKQGDVVYVGKAKSLRSRVRSYFQTGTSDTRTFIPLLGRLLVDIDTVVTGTEKEAAILENNLIKEHQPRFNVKLRGRQDVLVARAARRGSVAAARGGTPGRARQRAVLRAVPFGHRRAAHAAPRQQALPAAHVLRRGDGDAQAPVSAAPDQALRGAVRLRGRPPRGTASRSRAWRSFWTAATTSSRSSSGIACNMQPMT